MPKVKVLNQQGEKISEEELPSKIFDIEPNNALLHKVVCAFLANRRKPIASTKTRSERRGGGAKPWKQKGTGRARAGSSRSPIWKKGGVTFGPQKERNYRMKVSKQEKRKALFMGLSAKVKEDNLFVLEGLEMKEAKTKEAASLIRNLKLSDQKVILVIPKKDEIVMKSFRNLANVTPCIATSLNTFNILNSTHCLLLKGVPEILEKHLIKSRK